MGVIVLLQRGVLGRPAASMTPQGLPWASAWCVGGWILSLSTHSHLTFTPSHHPFFVFSISPSTQGAKHIRDVFYRMGFNDREIVALVGAHTLGECHADRSGFVGPWTR